MSPDSRTHDAGSESAPRIVVSGITGHVGRELACQLVASGVRVFGLTRQRASAVPPWPCPITLCHIDGSLETLLGLFREIRPDTVIHLAALARRDHLPTDVTPFIETNILLGTQLLEAMRHSDCRRFITAESILQYSDTGSYRPMNFYAATKQSFANLLSFYVDAFDIAAIALVLPTIYSEYEALPKLMTDIAASTQNGTTLNLQADDVLIDFVHVQDVAQSFVRASAILDVQTHAKGSLTRYCISSGTGITPRDLVALFERISEKTISVHRQPSQANVRRVSPWHGPVLPGWTPQVDLEAGIKRMLSKPR